MNKVCGNNIMIQQPFWGLVEQVGPWTTTSADNARSSMGQPLWRGGGVDGGGTSHPFHGSWFREANKPALDKDRYVTNRAEIFPSVILKSRGSKRRPGRSTPLNIDLRVGTSVKQPTPARAQDLPSSKTVDQPIKESRLLMPEVSTEMLLDSVYTDMPGGWSGSIPAEAAQEAASAHTILNVKKSNGGVGKRTGKVSRGKQVSRLVRPEPDTNILESVQSQLGRIEYEKNLMQESYQNQLDQITLAANESVGQLKSELELVKSRKDLLEQAHEISIFENQQLLAANSSGFEMERRQMMNQLHDQKEATRLAQIRQETEALVSLKLAKYESALQKRKMHQEYNMALKQLEYQKDMELYNIRQDAESRHQLELQNATLAITDSEERNKRLQIEQNYSANNEQVELYVDPQLQLQPEMLFGDGIPQDVITVAPKTIVKRKQEDNIGGIGKKIRTIGEVTPISTGKVITDSSSTQLKSPLQEYHLGKRKRMGQHGDSKKRRIDNSRQLAPMSISTSNLPPSKQSSTRVAGVRSENKSAPGSSSNIPERLMRKKKN